MHLTFRIRLVHLKFGFVLVHPSLDWKECKFMEDSANFGNIFVDFILNCANSHEFHNNTIVSHKIFQYGHSIISYFYCENAIVFLQSLMYNEYIGICFPLPFSLSKGFKKHVQMGYITRNGFPLAQVHEGYLLHQNQSRLPLGLYLSEVPTICVSEQTTARMETWSMV